MSKIEQNRERKKLAILRSAKHIFLSEGYVLASVDAIASQAKLTKQTLYRYFPSKQDLFKATLEMIALENNASFIESLSLPVLREALLGFAEGFVRFHLSPEHIATYRLLIHESIQAPEIVESFFDVGPDSTEGVLQTFMQERFPKAASKTELWLAMLLAPRNSILLGMTTFSDEQIKQHATEATEFLLAACD